MPRFVVDFGSLPRPPEPDGRLDAPAFHRNHEAIWSAVTGFLRDAGGDVLEVTSGTGQHAATFAARAPQLTWWPSDYQDSHLASIAAWRAASELTNLRPPQRIDLSDPDWRWRGEPGADDRLTAILAINLLHIAPWRVAENLMRGAGRHLRAGGRLFLYGPFMRDGAHTAPSNAQFDATLRAENPAWGVRDVADVTRLAEDAGLALTQATPMPANNLVLIFTRRPRQD